MPLLSRQGGLMLAFPTRVIEDEAFPALTAGEGNMVGPAEVFDDVELFEEPCVRGDHPQKLFQQF